MVLAYVASWRYSCCLGLLVDAALHCPLQPLPPALIALLANPRAAPVAPPLPPPPPPAAPDSIVAGASSAHGSPASVHTSERSATPSSAGGGASVSVPSPDAPSTQRLAGAPLDEGALDDDDGGGSASCRVPDPPGAQHPFHESAGATPADLPQPSCGSAATPDDPRLWLGAHGAHPLLGTSTSGTNTGVNALATVPISPVPPPAAMPFAAVAAASDGGLALPAALSALGPIFPPPTSTGARRLVDGGPLPEAPRVRPSSAERRRAESVVEDLCEGLLWGAVGRLVAWPRRARKTGTSAGVGGSHDAEGDEGSPDLTVVIDGVPFYDVRFVTICMSPMSRLKYFPVASFV